VATSRPTIDPGDNKRRKGWLSKQSGHSSWSEQSVKGGRPSSFAEGVWSRS
jgi:hypothetical protein